MITSVKPALRFLMIFLVTYVGLSLSYGLWIESVKNKADWLTWEVTRQVAELVSLKGNEVTLEPNPKAPTILVRNESRIVLEVFEGCNGVNVMIVFLSFVLAFGGTNKFRIGIFMLAGVILIHLANLLRLFALYSLALQNSKLFYYYHKFIFTASLYVMIFILWWVWINRWSGLRRLTHEH